MRELEPGLWRMLPEAGVPTREVQRLAREHGLFFAPDPGAAEQSQIGGNVATNAGGPHALKYGVTGAWVAGWRSCSRPASCVEIGGWAAKDVAGYDLRSLLIGSEGTLGIITAVRLRLLPAPAAALRAGRVPRLARGGLRGDRAELLGSGLRPSVLDFLDGEALALLAASYPGPSGAVPAGAGFALIVEVDGSRAEARGAARASCSRSLGGLRWSSDEPADAAALWRWRDGVNGVLTGVRGAKVSEDVVFPRERLREGLERFEADRRRARPALVLVRPRRRRQRARDGARRPRPRGSELDAADAVGRGAVRAGRGARRLGRRGARGGLAEARSLRVPVAAAGGGAARADQARLRSEGALEPGEEAGKVPCALAGHIKSRKEAR